MLCEYLDMEHHKEIIYDIIRQKTIEKLGYYPEDYSSIGEVNTYYKKDCTKDSCMGMKLDVSSVFLLNNYILENQTVNFLDLVFLSLKEFEKVRNRPVISLYYATPDFSRIALNSAISESDINSLYDILKSQNFDNTNEVDIILNTGGGHINTALSLITILRAKFNVVNLIVPRFAVSSGTLIATGCDEILVLEKSVFSMVNPSIAGVDTYFLKNTSFIMHLISYLHNKDYRKIYQLNLKNQAYALENHVKKILHRLLLKYGLRHKSFLQKHLGKYRIANKLLTFTNYYSHDYPLPLDELKALGLNIIPAEGETKRLMEQIDIVTKELMKQHNFAKLFTTVDSYISLNAVFNDDKY